MSSTDFGNTTEPVPPADRRARSLLSNPLFDLIRLAVAPKTAASSPTAAWIRQHPVFALIGLAYALTWIGLIPLIRDPGIASQANWSQASNPAVLVYAFLGVLGCFWAAVIVASATGGLARRAALLRGYLHWRVGAQWYFAVVLLPIGLWASPWRFVICWPERCPHWPCPARSLPPCSPRMPCFSGAT